MVYKNTVVNSEYRTSVYQSHSINPYEEATIKLARALGVLGQIQRNLLRARRIHAAFIPD